MRSAEEFCVGLPVASFAAGDALLDEGAQTGRLYVLLDGAVEVLKGDLQINVVADRGAIFGDMSVLLGIPHMATVRAQSACRAYLAENGAGFLQANPELSFILAKLVAHRLYGVTAYLADLKRQFEDQSNHLGMVDDILETLLHEQNNAFTPGSDRDPDY